MATECRAKAIAFAPVEGRAVVADFDGGAITSDAGALLLGATDRAIGLIERFAGFFTDGRDPERVVHDVAPLVGQRVLGVRLERLDAKHRRCAPLAGKSTPNRFEHGTTDASRYHRIAHDPATIENLFVELFLDAHAKPPKAITLDLDATDDPLHGHQAGRFFHGY